MANIKSAIKRAKQAKVRTERNKAAKHALADSRKVALAAIEAGNKEDALKGFSEYASKLDRAAKKGIIKKNTADRKKSRMAKAIAKIEAK
ncbi:MAG: 30S ribosomal protein S20 [Kiritimatiellae bacterium]|nr:30S ribosomal protein S20 [Kiritimatiellia bacterium]